MKKFDKVGFIEIIDNNGNKCKLEVSYRFVDEDTIECLRNNVRFHTHYKSLIVKD